MNDPAEPGDQLTRAFARESLAGSAFRGRASERGTAPSPWLRPDAGTGDGADAAGGGFSRDL